MNSNPTQRVKTVGEYPFVKMLNGILPKSIRVLAWCPIHRDFNARFNCTERVYTYLMPRANIDYKVIQSNKKNFAFLEDE